MTILFYDFEVFKYDWLVCICDPVKRQWYVIHNNKEGLKRFYEEHKRDIWVGYNSRSYDTFILKGILLDFDPYEINDWIIAKGRKGWEFSSMFNRIQLYNYDCMPAKDASLKQLEGFMGNDMRETSVPFYIDRKLTPEEYVEIVKYCKHDVEQTLEVFIRNKAAFDAHMSMLKTFQLPFNNISKTQAQLSALALGAVRKEWDDEWNYSIVDCLNIEKYKQVVNWYEQQKDVKITPMAMKDPFHAETSR